MKKPILFALLAIFPLIPVSTHAVAAEEAKAGALVAEISISGPYVGHSAPDGGISLFETEKSFFALLSRFRKATEDETVSCILIRVPDGMAGLNYSQVNEIQAAIRRAQAKKKKVVAYLPSGMLGTYALVSPSDRIYMTPQAMLIAAGFDMELLYFKGLLDKLGIKLSPLAAGKSKLAGSLEPLIQNHMSAEAKKMFQGLLDGIAQAMISAVAKGRGLEEKVVADLLGSGPYSAKQCIEKKLIDGVAYPDQLQAVLTKYLARPTRIELAYGIKRKAQETNPLVLLNQILNPQGRSTPRRPHLALVYLEGPIAGRAGGMMGGGRSIQPSWVIPILRKLRTNPNVKGVVLAINSPGGEGEASDRIAREVELLAKTKPVVASMGAVAASGGYYIAAPATKITANELTITGSIGVFGAKPVFGDLYRKVGITVHTLSKGKNSGLFSTSKDFTESQKRTMIKLLGEFYDRFLEVVKNGRGYSDEQVRKVAEGQVFTGVKAKELGLVDQIADLPTAIQLGKKLSGLPMDKKVPMMIYPEQKNVFEALFSPPEEETIITRFGLLPEGMRGQARRILAQVGPLLSPGPKVYAYSPLVFGVSF